MSNRPKKACTECRQQKARCDAHLDPRNPCSRCRRINLRCVISGPFQRERKRRRHSDLQHETTELRRQLTSRSDMQTSSPPMSTTLNPLRGQVAAKEPNPPQRYVDIGERLNLTSRSSRPPLPSIGVLETPDSLPCDSSTETIPPYKLEGLHIDSTDIDELFRTYFRDYAVFMPLLDPDLTPNNYYARCPLLFWAIAAVASRTCAKNPTLLELFSCRVRNLALLSLGQDAALYNIQGLLLLLKWPPPRTPANGDVNWPLCGAVLHMAMQIGLHFPLSSQEYSKVRLRLSETDVNNRIQTWAYCILVYQEICVGKGTPPTLMCDFSHDLEQRRVLMQNIKPGLRFEIKVQEVLAKFFRAVSNHGLRNLSADQERSLSVLIRVFRSEIDDVKLESSSGLEHLSYLIACLAIAAFELYKSPSAIDPQSLMALCFPACEFLERMDSMDRKGEIVIAAAPVYYLYGMLMSCQILVRLVKTSFSRYIDVPRARSAFFIGLSLSKHMSVVNNDIFSRHAAAVTQLWNSNRAFKRSDGTELVALRIRSRLAMSPVLDGMAWWREEYGGYEGVYPPWMNEPASLTIDADAHARAGPSIPAFPTENQDLLQHISDPFFTDFGWAMDEALLCSPWISGTEPPALG